MERILKRDLRINGIGSGSGGTYGRVNIEGIGKLKGDVTCTEFRANGRCTVNGFLKSVSADSSTDGGSQGARTEINGIVNIDGNVTAEVLKAEGVLTVNGSCEAEKFVISGYFNIKGMLNADLVDIRLYGACEAKEIGGGRIEVRKTGGDMSSMLGKLIPKFERKLVADTIEGDDLYLEYTRASVVRGERVEIGPGCNIGTVEYRDHHRISERSKIGEIKCTGPKGGDHE